MMGELFDAIPTQIPDLFFDFQLSESAAESTSKALKRYQVLETVRKTNSLV